MGQTKRVKNLRGEEKPRGESGWRTITRSFSIVFFAVWFKVCKKTQLSSYSLMCLFLALLSCDCGSCWSSHLVKGTPLWASGESAWLVTWESGVRIPPEPSAPRHTTGLAWGRSWTFQPHWHSNTSGQLIDATLTKLSWHSLRQRRHLRMRVRTIANVSRNKTIQDTSSFNTWRCYVFTWHNWEPFQIICVLPKNKVWTTLFSPWTEIGVWSYFLEAQNIYTSPESSNYFGIIRKCVFYFDISTTVFRILSATDPSFSSVVWLNNDFVDKWYI